MSWPEHWPTDVPSPVQHADGRWLSPIKHKPICTQHDPQPPDIWWHAKSGTRGFWSCKVCHRAAWKAYRTARKAGRSTERAADEVTLPQKITPAHPFDWTRVRLEREWGVPIEQWTPAQHRFHTRAIYHHLGWGDAALEGPMVSNGRRLDNPKLVASTQGLMRRVG